MLALAAVVSLLGGFVTACGDEAPPPSDGADVLPQAAPTLTASARAPSVPTDPAPSDAGSTVILTREMMGRARWPLTVDRVVVWCEGSAGSAAVYVRAGGALYPANRAARARSSGLPGIETITRRGPTARMDIRPIVEAGLRTCR